MRLLHILARTAVLGGVALGSTYATAALRYRPTVDALEYVSTNDYRMWFVHGTDTLGEPISTQTAESHKFHQAGGALQVQVELRAMGGGNFKKSDTFTITPSGRVLEVNGVPVDSVAYARIDLLPRLPESPVDLKVGTVWNDTVSSSRDGDFGGTYYRAERQYRLIRMEKDVAVLVAEGQLALRQGGWQDSTAGIYWWQEVRGPVVDSVWFNTANGQLIRAVTSMNLSGVGGYGRGDQVIEMPSGLDSRVDRRRK